MARGCAYITLGLSACLLAPAAYAQEETRAPDRPKEAREERILYGFVPDIDRLEFIDGKALAERYQGETIKGIYSITPHSDQRYVEHFSRDGKTRYREGAFTSTGRWYVKGDLLCFRYDENPDEAHCGYEFEYGDCIISYSRYMPIIGGKPANPAGWSSVNKPAHKDFDWDTLSLEAAKNFSCYSLVS